VGEPALGAKHYYMFGWLMSMERQVSAWDDALGLRSPSRAYPRPRQYNSSGYFLYDSTSSHVRICFLWCTYSLRARGSTSSLCTAYTYYVGGAALERSKYVVYPCVFTKHVLASEAALTGCQIRCINPLIGQPKDTPPNLSVSTHTPFSIADGLLAQHLCTTSRGYQSLRCYTFARYA